MTTNNPQLLAVAAVLILSVIPATSNADSWELRTTLVTVPGTHEIEAGKIDKGIQLSKNWLSHIDKRKKVGVLTNLCVGFIIRKDFEQATEYYDLAVQESGSKSVTYNNRGVLMAMQGRYEDAERDFAMASQSGCDRDCSSDAPNDLQHPRAIAMRNLEKANVQVKAADESAEERVAAITD